MSAQSILRLCAALLSGALFGLGLSYSGMINPARVLGFLNLASGHWDPSLMFVMGGALIVAVPGMLLQRRFAKPILDQKFHMPEQAEIDSKLVIGSALFGAGWGMAGFCPGPAVAGLVTGMWPVILFVACMAIGMLAHDRLMR